MNKNSKFNKAVVVMLGAIIAVLNHYGYADAAFVTTTLGTAVAMFLVGNGSDPVDPIVPTA